MLKRSTIFLGLMLTGSLAAAWLSEEESPDAGVVAPVIAVKPRDTSAKRHSIPVLRLEKLARAEVSDPEQDPFAGKSWYVAPPPPPPSKPQAAPSPTAPALPFRYMGRMREEGGKPVVYLTQGTRAYSLSEGDTIDGTYRLDSVSSGQLVLTYLPMNIKQTLNTASAPGMDSMMENNLPGLPTAPGKSGVEGLPQ